jgi:hypothetical protein
VQQVRADGAPACDRKIGELVLHLLRSMGGEVFYTSQQSKARPTLRGEGREDRFVLGVDRG